jgi:hypothetical protein
MAGVSFAASVAGAFTRRPIFQRPDRTDSAEELQFPLHSGGTGNRGPAGDGGDSNGHHQSVAVGKQSTESRAERLQRWILRWRGEELPDIVDGETRIATNQAIIQAVGPEEARRIAKEVRDRFIEQDFFPDMKGTR